jgi:hypothetical protein
LTRTVDLTCVRWAVAACRRLLWPGEKYVDAVAEAKIAKNGQQTINEFVGLPILVLDREARNADEVPSFWMGFPQGCGPAWKTRGRTQVEKRSTGVPAPLFRV